jgi:hypothetical protein
VNGDTEAPGVVRSGAGVLGLGAAACAACCAGPILGALGAVGVASAVGYALAGGVAVVAGIAAAAAVIARRRRRRRACAAPTGTVALVDAPTTRRPTQPVDAEAVATSRGTVRLRTDPVR